MHILYLNNLLNLLNGQNIIRYNQEISLFFLPYHLPTCSVRSLTCCWVRWSHAHVLKIPVKWKSRFQSFIQFRDLPSTLWSLLLNTSSRKREWYFTLLSLSHQLQFTVLPLLPELKPGARGGLEENRKAGLIGADESSWSVSSLWQRPKLGLSGVFL